MSKQTKKIFVWVMTFAMLLSLLPAAGLTALADEKVEYPAIEEPVFEEPVFEEPVFEEPVFEEPVFEEPEPEPEPEPAGHTHSDTEMSFETKLTADGGTLSSGSYYLDSDLTLTNNLTIPSGETVNLCLNGHVLKGTGTGSVITNKGTLNIYDCNTTTKHYFTEGNNQLWTWNGDATETGCVVTGGVITGGIGYYTGSYVGGGVYNAGELTMTGGTICGNTANYGGGVYIVDKGLFTMTGGTISHNFASKGGGGVLLQNGDRFNMNGETAVIENCSASFGGGIYVVYSSIANLTKGTVRNNISSADNNEDGGGGIYLWSDSSTYRGTCNISADVVISGNRAVNGGGIYSYNGIVQVDGAKIIDNTVTKCGGGIFCIQNSTLTVSGKADVTGNTLTDKTTANNVYLTSGKTITVNTPQTGMSIGVTLASGTGNVTGSNSADYSSYFQSDNTAYSVINSGEGTAQVVKLDKLQISVTGTTVADKTYDGRTDATAELGTVSGIKDGDDVTVTPVAKFEDANAGEDKNVTVTYTLSGDDAGKYIAPDTEMRTANITKAPVEVPTAESFTYDKSEKTALTIAGDALYELDSSVEGGKIKATDAGTYSFYVKLKDTANYEWKLETPTSDSQQIMWSIAKASVEVPTAETNLVYDGKVQTGVPTGDLYDITDNTGINASTEYKATATLKNSDNYKWSTGDAETTTRDIPWSIARRTVTLWSETASKDYDGTALTAPDVYGDSNKTPVDSVFANEVTGLEATGSVTYVSQGEVTNEITYTFNEGCSKDNYSITKNEGKLIVTRAGTMTITGSDYTGVYDGEAHGEAATPSKDGSTVFYQTSTDNATWSEWSETVPQITDAGTWYVKAKAENPNYTDATCDYTLTVNQFTGNTITGLTCENIKKDETPAPTATATFGEITYSYSKDGETWGDWESIYSESGEYQVKAVVAETANYNGCESEPVTFRVGYVCEGWKIVKFDELNPGQYKMYLNNTDTGVYNFAMVVGGYTIQDAETGKYICLENGKIVLKDTTNPTAWAKGIASFHASAVSTGRWGFSTRYYLNVDRDGNLIADRLPGITHFATYVEADEHEYYVHSNFNSTHTHTCIVCGDSYEEDCTPNRWNFCTECGGYVKSGSSWWKW